MALVIGRYLLVVLLGAWVAGCVSEDLAPQPKFVSNRGATKAADRYFIEFRSRYALSYGHSYVVFGQLNKAGAMVSPEVAGRHPASDSEVPYVLGHFMPVAAETGWSDGDLEEQYRSASWRVMLSEPEYRKAVADIRRLQKSSKVWHASLANCNEFVADVARSMGYKTPGPWLRPQQFITKLREMNT